MTDGKKIRFPTLCSAPFLPILLMLFLSFARPADIFAQGSRSIFPPKLSLEAAVEQTLENNPQTKKSAAEMRLAENRIAEARTGRKPSVEFTQSLIRSNNPTFVFGSLLEQGRFGTANFAVDALNHPDGLNNFRSILSAQMPLFDRKQTRSRITQAEIARDRTELQAESVRQQLRFGVIRDYYGVILGKELVNVSREAVRSADANRIKTRDMVEVGMTTKADYLAADVEYANVDLQKLEAENNLVTTVAALNLTLGNSPDFESEYTGSLTERYFPVEDRDELIRLAFENRADYKQAELAVSLQREQTQAVKDQKLPAVNAFGNFGYSSPYIANGSTDYTVGVSLNYTLFDAGRKARLAQAAEGETIAELEKENLANRIRLEVIRAQQNYQTARAKIEVSVRAIAQSEEVLRIVQDRYKFGLTTFNEVLRAEAALVRSKHNLLTAQYEYLVSYAEVLLATGRLTDVRVFE